MLPSALANPYSALASHVAVGSIVDIAMAVTAVTACGAAVIRPPGHHAEPGESSAAEDSLNIFNNVAVRRWRWPAPPVARGGC